MINQLIALSFPLFPKKLVWLFSKRYIAGETLEDAIKESKDLNEKGIKVTVDLLGEFITNLLEAEKYKDQYLQIINAVESNKIDGNYSLKPTMFGLLLDEEVCYQNIREIVAKAAEHNNFVRVDMEDSACIDKELKLFRKLKEEFPKNVGLVFQSYMKRTLDDLKSLEDLNTKDTPLNFRICKGIYVEPKEIAFKKYAEVNEHFLKDLEYMFQNKIYPGIATHDKPLVKGAYELIEKYNVPKDMYEFQMLHGVTPELRKAIIKKGHTMRIYVPFGSQWFGYCARRVKENPKMASQLLKALFVRG